MWRVFTGRGVSLGVVVVVVRGRERGRRGGSVVVDWEGVKGKWNWKRVRVIILW